MAFVKTALDPSVLFFKLYRGEGGEIVWDLWKEAWETADEASREVHFPIFQLLI
jgi:hypothetical protein